MRTAISVLAVCGIGCGASLAQTAMYDFIGSSGLSAEAEFTLVDATTVSIRVRNTSTGAPAGFDGADQLLTSISFDLDGAMIVGGSAMTGSSSYSIGYGANDVGPNENIGGEWGYGNAGTTGLFNNFISTNTAGTTARFDPSQNLGGPPGGGLNGPEGGIIANPAVASLGGLSAIQDEVIFTITISAPIQDLSFLDRGVRIEWGSDAEFTTGALVPTPGSAALLLASGVLAMRRRR